MNRVRAPRTYLAVVDRSTAYALDALPRELRRYTRITECSPRVRGWTGWTS
jgi:hypothetical protein